MPVEVDFAAPAFSGRTDGNWIDSAAATFASQKVLLLPTHSANVCHSGFPFNNGLAASGHCETQWRFRSASTQEQRTTIVTWGVRPGNGPAIFELVG